MYYIYDLDIHFWGTFLAFYLLVTVEIQTGNTGGREKGMIYNRSGFKLDALLSPHVNVIQHMY